MKSSKQVTTDKLSADVVVIGGGPAGMMAALTAAERGRSVILLERNGFTGKKLNITGKGRCNITNNCTPDEVVKNTPGNGRFLYGAVNRFSPTDTIAFFESRGLRLKTERGNRVFPESDRAADVTDTLRSAMKRAGVRVLQGRASEILTSDGAVSGVRFDRETVSCSSVVIATGGLSYPGTGSTGDGYRLAEKLGHTVTKTCASIVPLESGDTLCGDMQGLGLKNVGVKAFNQAGKLVYEDFGELLFTHFGISGPTVLSMSAHMRDFENNSYHVIIDLKPALDERTLDLRILRDFEANKNKSVENILPGLVPRAMAGIIADMAGITGRQANSVTKGERERLIGILKGFKVNISGARPVEEAVVTSGGVSVKEINPKTMESRLVSRLFFAGEIIDVDAYTGGFNLQIAWSTGYVAGENV